MELLRDSTLCHRNFQAFTPNCRLSTYLRLHQSVWMLTEIYIEALLTTRKRQNLLQKRKPRRSGADNWSSVLLIIALSRGEEAPYLSGSLVTSSACHSFKFMQFSDRDHKALYIFKIMKRDYRLESVLEKFPMYWRRCFWACAADCRLYASPKWHYFL